MKVNKLPSDMVSLRSEISKKRGIISDAELSELEAHLFKLEEEAIIMSGPLDIDDDPIAQGGGDESMDNGTRY